YAMTPPAFFAVECAINPWMDTNTPVDVDVALAQWETLRQTYLRLGHAVDARFRFAERAGESKAYSTWMSSLGLRPVTTRHINEGQGDLLMVGEMVLAGYGFRTDRRAH